MTAPFKPSKPLSREEFTALGTIARARQENLRAMFGGATIVYGKVSAAGSAKSIVLAGRKVGKNAKSLAKS